MEEMVSDDPTLILRSWISMGQLGILKQKCYYIVNDPKLMKWIKKGRQTF